jgi:hypothetical protein
MTQTLSPTARRNKAARDKAYAMTTGRKAKKAHAERMARKQPEQAKGKDYDHNDQRWESPAQNRSNDGQGTKSEGNNNYKTN